MTPYESYPTNPCASGHVWLWVSRDAQSAIPQGQLCQCGQVVAVGNGFMLRKEG